MKKKKLICAIIILVIILLLLFLTSILKKEYKIFIPNIDYGNLLDLIEYNSSENFELKTAYKPVSFTIGENRLSYKLIEGMGLENMYYYKFELENRGSIKLIEGSFPNNNNEVMIPSALKYKYKIGDKITLNTGNIYGLKTGIEEKVLAEYSLSNFIEDTLEYEDLKKLKEFAIVGFFDYYNNDYIKRIINDIGILQYDKNSVYYEEVPFFTYTDHFEKYDTVYSVVSYKSLIKKDAYKSEYSFLKKARELELVPNPLVPDFISIN